MAESRCKLTHKGGKFVKAHLIPQAFTKPETPGDPLMQFGQGHKPKRRWSSWYDPTLVNAEGELILRDLDTWAISFLRKAKLVWSGWGPVVSLNDQTITVPHLGWGIRRVQVPDKDRLRLFMLSILWRAAATSLPEFHEIRMPPADLETLRLALLNQIPPPIDFYPASLTQLSTLGVQQNLTPIAQSKPIPSLDDEPARIVPIFRFYFDGLIIHFHRQTSDDGHTQSLGPLVVGSEQAVVVSTVPYEVSFQHENLQNSILDLINPLIR